MRGLDYAQVNALITRQTGRIVSLDASSFAILLDALNSLGAYGGWHNDGVDLTISEWDTVENWLATAYNNLLTIYECAEGEPPGGNGVASYAILRDEKATTVDGGSAAATTWQQRDINIIVSDVDSIVSLSSNKFTPIASDFRIAAYAHAFDVDSHRIRLYNVTQASVVEEGRVAYCSASANASTYASLDALFSANGSDEYRIDHYTKTARAGNGLGVSVKDGSIETFLAILLEDIG